MFASAVVRAGAPVPFHRPVASAVERFSPGPREVSVPVDGWEIMVLSSLYRSSLYRSSRYRRAKPLLVMLVGLGLLAAACSSAADQSADEAEATNAATEETLADDGTEPTGEAEGEPADDEAVTADPNTAAGQFNARDTFGEPPPIPTDYNTDLDAALARVFGDTLPTAGFATTERDALQAIEDSGDPRMAWYIADLLRFFGGTQGSLITAAETLTGLDLSDVSPWGYLTNHLIAWDVPAPPGYVTHKRALFTEVVAEWEPFFEDDSDVDYRLWSWGGVGIDDRPLGRTDIPCNCIPAVDNPEVTDAAGGDWYADDRIVFGVEINGEARAYPRNIMEIREMVNDTLGGRDIGMPYCTLCGAAQVYFTDELPAGVERPVLRTSGLLTRSNKVMYDVNSFSVFDTFLGTAVTGPLAEAGLQLDQASVVTTTWGEWKAAHPDTTILAESEALGRDSDLLNTRDAEGPIFPIGDVDPRLPVQEPVLGVTTGAGQPVAFPVDAARQALNNGQAVGFDDITVELFGGGIRAIDEGGDEVGSHQAFWFAWSQFHPDTELWTG